MQAKALTYGISTAAFLAVIAITAYCQADGINLSGHFNYTQSESTVASKLTGQTLSSTMAGLNQRYKLDLTKRLYPNLNITAAAGYHLDTATGETQGERSETETRTLTPSVELTLKNSLYQAGIGYGRLEQTRDTGGNSDQTRTLRDTLHAAFSYRPEDLPPLNLNYSQTHSYNAPLTTDTLSRTLQFDTRYHAWKALQVNYAYSLSQNENRLSDYESLSQNHNGRIGYAKSFLDNRLNFSTNYRLQYQSLRVPGASAQATEYPRLRANGLASVADTAQDGALTVVDALIDGDTALSSGIDIGLSADENRFTSVGLDFGFAVSVDKLHLWIDRPLSTAAFNAFGWAVYTNEENSDTSAWTPVSSGVASYFDSFENRIVITFPAVTARFVKVVTRPLTMAPGIDLNEFENVLVTELQAFATIRDASGENETFSVDHAYSFGVYAKLSKQTNLGSSFSYRLRTEEPLATTDSQVSNGLYLSHSFNRQFSLNLNASRTEKETPTGSTVNYGYGAALKANHLPTLSQTLSYSGGKTTGDKDSTTSNAFMLRTQANLYQGWSAFADVGYTISESQESGRTRNTLLRTGTSLTPNSKVSVSMHYQQNRSLQDNDAETSENVRSSWGVQTFITPYEALAFKIDYSVSEYQGYRTSLLNYSVNWSPFPDGTLQVFLTYNESFRPESDSLQRSMGPSLQWTVSRHATLALSYILAESETPFQTTDNKNFSLRLRLVF